MTYTQYSHRSLTVKSHICVQAPLQDRAHMRICVYSIVYMLYTVPNTPTIGQSRVAINTASTIS